MANGEINVGKMIGSGVAVVAVLVLGLSFLFGSWFTVDGGDRAVVVRNGDPVAVYSQGLHLKFPWVDSVTEFSVRTKKVSWDYDSSTKTDYRLIAYSKDIQTVTVGVAVNYHLDETKIKDIYLKQGVNYEANLIHNNVPNQVKDVLGRFVANDIIGQRDQVANQISDELRKVLGPYGIVIEQVQLTGTQFSGDFEKSIEARMQAEIAVKKKEQELQQAEVDAKTARAKAEGEAAAVKAAADGNAYQQKTMADSQAYETKVTAAADAEAIRIKSQALNSNPGYVDLVRSEKWDGKLPTQMIPGTTVPFLDLKAGK